ncbi:hypothetical protein [Flavobacterium polysaccharolyticum]|uniref:Transmembrane protein n=1 Tax=Flavobacterium polysaccharolyticum TaxID=3133148 RepID=A0ABU9NPE1_9FLAO
MSPSHCTKTLVCFLLFSFFMVCAKGKVAKPFSSSIDGDSLSSPLPKGAYVFPSYTHLPISKVFQPHNNFSTKSKRSHRKRKGKAALPVL